MYTAHLCANIHGSLNQNVTVTLSSKQTPEGIRETPPTTFLFLLIFNCQKTDATVSIKDQNVINPRAKP